MKALEGERALGISAFDDLRRKGARALGDVSGGRSYYGPRIPGSLIVMATLRPDQMHYIRRMNEQVSTAAVPYYRLNLAGRSVIPCSMTIIPDTPPVPNAARQLREGCSDTGYGDSYDRGDKDIARASGVSNRLWKVSGYPWGTSGPTRFRLSGTRFQAETSSTSLRGAASFSAALVRTPRWRAALKGDHSSPMLQPKEATQCGITPNDI